LRVTEIKKLIRDPYAIYARRVLGLEPLDPLVGVPNPAERGSAFHDIFEVFVRASIADPSHLTASYLTEVTAEVLDQKVPWPTARRLWRAKLARITEAFVTEEIKRQQRATPHVFEVPALLTLPDIGFTVTGRADRIDLTKSGELIIYDYKTGAVPTLKEQTFFDKQLLIEAAMAEMGAFENLTKRPVEKAIFLGVGSKLAEVNAPLDVFTKEDTLRELTALLSAYLSVEQGFTARRALQKESDQSAYDHLSRYGEWDASDPSHPEVIT